jgi:hypothetical protein
MYLCVFSFPFDNVGGLEFSGHLSFFSLFDDDWLRQKSTLVTLAVFFDLFGVIHSFFVDFFGQYFFGRFCVIESSFALLGKQGLEEVLFRLVVAHLALAGEWTLGGFAGLGSGVGSGEDGVFLDGLKFLEHLDLLLSFFEYFLAGFLEEFDAIEHFFLSISQEFFHLNIQRTTLMSL